MIQPKKYKGFEMFDEKEPGKPQNWWCTIMIVILVCSTNILIIIGLRCMLEIKNKIGDPILNAEQRDLVTQALILMSMSFGFGCCGCFCCACRIPFYFFRALQKIVKYSCSQFTEDENEISDDDSLINNMYDQRNYKKNLSDAESGLSKEIAKLPTSPSSQALARYTSRLFTKGWGSSTVKSTINSPVQSIDVERLEEKPPIRIITDKLMEPMESVKHIEQQLFCLGLLTAKTPAPRISSKRRLTLATDTPLFDGKNFIF